MKLKVKRYSQQNDLWNGMTMGDTSLKLGEYGCLVTCCAMVLTYYGKDINPRHLNEVLERVQAYNGAYLKWNPFADNFDLSFGGLEKFKDIPAPVDRIKNRIDNGHPTIVKVDFVPETRPIDQHFVVVVGYTEKDLLINDPWTGEEYFLTAKYPHSNNRWNQPKYVIYGIRELTPNFDWNENQAGPLDKCLKQVDRLTRKIDELTNKLESKQNKIVTLESELQTSESVRETLGKEVEEYSQKIEKVSKSRDEFHSELKSAKAKLSELAKDNKELKEEFNNTNRYYHKALKYDIRKYEPIRALVAGVMRALKIEPIDREDKKDGE